MKINARAHMHAIKKKKCKRKQVRKEVEKIVKVIQEGENDLLGEIEEIFRQGKLKKVNIDH